MKLDYNTMQPGQEFWATRNTFVEKLVFITKNPLSYYGIFVEDMGGNKKELLYFPNQGVGDPFDNKLEALQYRLKMIKFVADDETKKIQDRIAEAEAENGTNL